MFEWDKEKAHQNSLKHGIDFPDTFAVFEDPNALTLEDEWDYGEERFITIGMDAFGRILVLVYTWKNENIRIISARKANKTEINQYENKL